MAESDTQTTPPAAEDGRARVNPNGTVSTEGGREAFVWCQDNGTGHRFDLPARALPIQGVTVIEGYPLNYNRIGREPKTATTLAGDPAEPKGTRVEVQPDPADKSVQTPPAEQPAPPAEQPAPTAPSTGSGSGGVDGAVTDTVTGVVGAVTKPLKSTTTTKGATA